MEIIISSILANLFTTFAKPKEEFQNEQYKATRRKFVLVLNAVAGLVFLFTASYLTGNELALDEVTGYVEVLLTFLGSQGSYFLYKKSTE